MFFSRTTRPENFEYTWELSDSEESSFFLKIMILGGIVGPHQRIKCKYIEKTLKYRLLWLR
jgi:hypothetical protein